MVVAMARAAVLLSAVLTPAMAYYHVAAAVNGDVVMEAGNLTGGKVGTYTVLLQVLNPGYGDMKLLVECCGAAMPLAGEIAAKINTNAYEGDVEAQIRKEYVDSPGLCTAPGPIEALAKEGDTKCSYMYSFKNRDWRKYEYTAQCIPSDVCAVDVVGATKGLKGLYPVVIQILNPNAGDMQYAGLGPIGACLEGMNMVNTANLSQFKHVEPMMIDIFGTKIPIGQKESIKVKGMKQLGLGEMFSKCENRSDTGMLYVFKNHFWINQQHAMNITHYNIQLEREALIKEIQQRVAKMQKDKTPKTPASGATPAAPGAPQGFDLVKAIGDIGGALVKELSKHKDGADKEIQKEEEKEEKIEKAQLKMKAEAKEAPKVATPPPAAPKVGGSFGYGGFPEEKVPGTSEVEGLGYGGTMDKEAAEKILTAAAEKAANAPEPPKAPEVPKVEAPEPPKAPEVPKVEAPEPPKAPEVPKVEAPEPPKAPKVPKVEAPEPPKAPEVPKVEAPEPPKAPELPKVEVPEPPKAPELPKVEVPEPPKAPEVPKVEVGGMGYGGFESAEVEDSDEKVTSRRLQDKEHIMI